MKTSIPKIVGGAVLIVGFFVLGFGGLQAWLEWGGGPENRSVHMQTLDKNLQSGAEISAVIGARAIALGWRIRRMKRGSK